MQHTCFAVQKSLQNMQVISKVKHPENVCLDCSQLWWNFAIKSSIVIRAQQYKTVWPEWFWLKLSRKVTLFNVLVLILPWLHNFNKHKIACFLQIDKLIKLMQSLLKCFCHFYPEDEMICCSNEEAICDSIYMSEIPSGLNGSWSK